MSTCIAPKVAADAPPSEKMERKCRQAWYDQYHKVRPLISYADWRTVWFACLERVGIDSADPEQPSRFDAANESLSILETTYEPLGESERFATVRNFFDEVFE